MDTLPTPSARALRGQWRSAQGEASRLHWLQAAGKALAEEPQIKSALARVLGETLRQLAVDAGLVLWQDGGALTVQAATGAVLPVGASLPLGGVLGTVLRPPWQAAMREHVESRLRVGQSQQVAMELLLPLCLGGKALGVLALLSGRTVALPSEDDLATLHTLATLLAAALHTQAATKPRASKRQAAASLARLTAREQQVFALLPRGLGNAEIAAELGIATGTAKVHMERILHKLGLKDRTQAAVRAAEWGHRA